MKKIFDRAGSYLGCLRGELDHRVFLPRLFWILVGALVLRVALIGH